MGAKMKHEPPVDLPRREERPDAEWVRGTCPQCGEDLVSQCYYISGTGYIILWECWNSMSETPTCDYRKKL